MSEETTALIPVEERQVDFYGDDITAALVGSEGQEQIYVPIRPICEYLGLSWAGQRERIMRDDVLAGNFKGVRVTRTPSGKTRSGGAQETLCLPLEYLPGWLFGIDVSRVRPELKEKITRYRRDCFKVLWQAFQTDAFSIVEQPAPAPNTALVQIREMGLAIAQMAEEQMAMEQRLNSRLDNAVIAFKNLDARVTGLEKRLSPRSHITEGQAAEVGQAVKALAEYLTTQDKSKNHYQGVYQELYRRFGVSSYKNIRADQFTAVMKFLEDWKLKGTGK